MTRTEVTAGAGFAETKARRFGARAVGSRRPRREYEIFKDIFDLVKVDYIVSDLEKVRGELFTQASDILKSKHKKYMDTFGITLNPRGLAIEKYDAFYPSERYKGYVKSFYYEPIEQKSFDRVINSVGIEPLVQFTVYLRMDYSIEKLKEK